MDAIERTFEKDKEKMESFGYRLYNQFSVNKAYRRDKELVWLEDLRSYKGIYDPDVRIEPENSKVYPRYARSKVNISLSRMHEMLFPDTDRNWEISPTPDPKISPEIIKQIVGKMIEMRLAALQQQAQGKPVDRRMAIPSIEDVRLAIMAFAKATCENMQTVIDDQLTEMDYPEETKKVLKSGLMFGTGIIKGPLVNKRTKHIWIPNDDGDFLENEDKENVPYFKSIRIWDWYPDMTTTDMETAEGSFERHLMTKHDLRNLMGRDDFYADVIKEYLSEHPTGDYVPENWEVDLQTIEVMSGSGKSYYTHTSSDTPSVHNTNAGTKTTSRQMGKKYEVLEFWGFVDGSDLEACGVQVDDVELEYGCNVWLLGKKPIKATLFKGASEMYNVFYYEKDETSLYGEGLIRIMRHSSVTVASAARMLIDNAACVAGPQVEVNWNLITKDTDLNSFYPRKIWYREGRGIEAQYPAVRVYNIDSHIEELSGIIKLFQEMGDIETCLPTWMISQTTNNETAQATSGRNSQITVSIKDVVKNFDVFTERNIRSLYAWNMEFNPRKEIKGDYNVKARGVSSLVMKEIRMQALNQFQATLAPEDLVYIDRRTLLSERLKAHDLNIPLKTEAEAEKIRQQQANSIMNQLNIEAIKAEIAKDRAQAYVNITKAKERNVMAEKEAQTPPEMPSGPTPQLQNAELQEQNARTEGAQLDNASKMAQIRRDEEAHRMDLTHKHEDHMMETVKGVDEHRKNLELKDKQAKHAEKMKEISARQRAKQGGKKK